MPLKCCIPTCKLQSDDPGANGVSFHSVPSNSSVRAQWTEILKNYNIETKKHTKVCSRHFTPSCFYYSGLCRNLRIKKESCPTVFDTSEKDKLFNTPSSNKIISRDQFSDESQSTCNEGPASESSEFHDESFHGHKNVVSDSINVHDGKSLYNPKEPIREESCSITPVLNEHVKLSDTENTINNSSKKIVKWVRKSLANTDVQSLVICKDNEAEIKCMLNYWKTEVKNLRRKCKTQQRRLNRWKNSVDEVVTPVKRVKKIKIVFL